MMTNSVRRRNVWKRLAFGLVALASAGTVLAGETEPGTFIEHVRDTEDLVRLDGTNWVIASGRKAPGRNDSGHLYLINAVTGVAETIYPDASSNRPIGELGAACPGAPDPANFEAHGLGIAPAYDGHYRLLSVDHAFPTGGREAVELFSIDATGPKPVVVWNDCVPMPEHTSGNDVLALPDGGFAVTNFSDPADKDVMGKLERGENTGNVLEWHKGKGFSEVPGSEMSGPNGIETDPLNRYYFVNAWGSKELVRLGRGQRPVERKVAKTGFLSDNNAWTWNGKLIVVGQATSVTDLFTCLSSPADFCATPFKALEFDPQTLKSRELIDDAHPKSFGGGTSPLPVGNELWVGSFRSDRIARYPLD